MLFTILLAASIASIVDLGGLVLFWDYARSRKIIYLILSFAAGVLLTASFQEIIPEGLAEGANREHYHGGCPDFGEISPDYAGPGNLHRQRRFFVGCALGFLRDRGVLRSSRSERRLGAPDAYQSEENGNSFRSPAG